MTTVFWRFLDGCGGLANQERSGACRRAEVGNAVSFSSVMTMNLFPSPRCAPAIQIVRPRESIAVHRKLIRLVACFSRQTHTATTDRDLSSVQTKNSARFSNLNEARTNHIPLPKCRIIRYNSRSAASLYDAITHIPSIPVPAALCFERLRPSRRLHRRDVGFRHP